jgi:hypothetical protein
MSTDEDRALLTDIAERQKALQTELSGLAEAQAQMYGTYSRSDSDYRAQLDSYARDQQVLKVSRRIATVIQVVSFLLLAFIAYRVSR